MAHLLIMPRQGNTVESCIIVDWKVNEGDSVSADTAVCEVETDKATFEVPAGENGTILKILHEAGDDVPVLEGIAVIGEPGEDWQMLVEGTDSAEQQEAKPSANETPSAEPASGVAARETTETRPEAKTSGTDPAAASPRAKKRAENEALNLSGLGGSGPGGRIIERDVQAALEQRPALTAAAKAAARDASSTILAAGTAIGGRVSFDDLGTASATNESSDKTGAGTRNAALPLSAAEDTRTETPIKGIRKLIAERMHASLATTAQFTLSSSAPALKLQQLRKRFKESNEELGLSKVSINDMILFATARILPYYPFMNAHKNDDTLVTFDRVHLGVAVDTARGLMVPVIRNADLLSLEQISSEAKRLAAACQNGTVKAEELSGSTFTVTNLGALGVENFTPVINVPEVAILGVCNIQLKPVAAPEQENGVAFVPHIGFSLTINHQVVDGAPAARFLAALCQAVSDLDLWLAK